MSIQGWTQLLAPGSVFGRAGRYPIAAYSEFMPPPRLGQKPYGCLDRQLLRDDDPWGWQITEYEQAWELHPGLRLIAHELLAALRHLGQGEPAHGIAPNKLHDNPYWPSELQQHSAPPSERYLVLAPLALARTQDDKGRVRWTLFGGSEQGPSRAFWRGFYADPKTELPADFAHGFWRHVLHEVYGESIASLTDLAEAGLRILPCTDQSPQPLWREDTLPSWTRPLLYRGGSRARGMKYLVTFCPFGRLPAAVRKAYLADELYLLPFPGSLIFWGAPPYATLAQELAMAAQIPLLHSIERHAAPIGIRVPQSGWLHEPRPGAPAPTGNQGPVRNTYVRTHRWARVHRDDDELAVSPKEDRTAHVMFSTAANDLGLYGKPMARNVQIWTRDYELLLDGPRANAVIWSWRRRPWPREDCSDTAFCFRRCASACMRSIGTVRSWPGIHSGPTSR